MHLVSYYDDLRSNVDSQFVTKLAKINDIELKEETNKKWLRIIELLEKSLTRCLNNTIPNELVNKTKQFIANLDASKTNKSTKELASLKMRNKLESHLLSNEFSLVMFVPSFERRMKMIPVNFQKSCCGIAKPRKEEIFLPHRVIEYILIAEEGFHPTEIENFIRSPLDHKYSKFDGSNYNYMKTKKISEAIKQSIENIVYIESFENKQKFQIDLKNWPVSETDDFGGVDLLQKHFNSFTKLKELRIGYCTFDELTIFKELTNLHSLHINHSKIENFETSALLHLKSLKELELDNCIIRSLNLDAHLQLNTFHFSGGIAEFVKQNFFGFETVETLNFDKLYLLSFRNGCLVNFENVELA